MLLADIEALSLGEKSFLEDLTVGYFETSLELGTPLRTSIVILSFKMVSPVSGDIIV